MSKRKILLLALCLGLVAILAVGGTLAYFTDEESAKNVFTVGNVDIELTEPEWENGGKEDAKEVYPGEPIAKDPTIQNIGANPCFVRVKVVGWDCFDANAEGVDVSNITFRTDYEDGKLGDHWEFRKEDGYYYYTKVMAAGDKTDALFDQVVIPLDLTNGDAETEFSLDVYAEAVQAQGAKPSFADVEKMTVAEIAAWFTTCGFTAN